TISNNSVSVTWTPYVGCDVVQYHVLRKEDGNNDFHELSVVDSDVLSYVDNTVYCAIKYSYQIKATDLCGTELYSWSDTAGAIAKGIQHRQVSEVIRATVVNNESVFLEWTIPPNSAPGYQIYRSEDNGQYIPIITIPFDVNAYNDLNTDVMHRNYHYKIEVLNNCPTGNEPGNIGSSILLSSEKIDKETGILRWTPYEGWENGVEGYLIQRINELNQWETIKTVPGNTLEIIIDY
ncbi:MAG: fibronectin type III domain-containing protein, partial [Bacteroidetes bacterium]|nr:fibronectin type III domain-containing protein [Bacteroidota bacterium]